MIGFYTPMIVGRISTGQTDDIWWMDEGQDYPRLWWERSDEGAQF